MNTLAFKKRTAIAGLATLSLVLGVAGAVKLTASAETQSDLYWSSENAPVLYGASEITLSKDAVETFDLSDARFRVFAKDFEDGDLAVSNGGNPVVPNQAGEYEIEYSATDRDGNTSTMTVKVHVTDEETHTAVVKRVMYTTPSDWNMALAGFSRCNNGDRQIAGIYLPAGASFEMRVLSGPNVEVNLLGDDDYRESGYTVQSGKEDYTTITNTQKAANEAKGEPGGFYPSVPFLTTVKLARGTSISTTYEIELRYDTSAVKPLNYYHYGDNGGGAQGEAAFVDRWRQSGDEYGVIENDVLTILAPFGDVQRAHEFEFDTLDAHMDYYKRVVERMDSIIGLSYNATVPTDQNIHYRNLVKANAQGPGGAYYAGSHIGVSGKITAEDKKTVVRGFMYSFFQMNWGGLHEIAHGYQGYLGKGEMGLGETANNILAYYIQSDKSLYTAKGDWLGSLSSIEQAQNDLRLSGKKFTEVAEKTRLYVLINLFEQFDGEETYSRMFSYYRAKLNDGTFNTSTPNQEVYARFFKDEYDTDILPYWSAWGLEVDEETKEDVSKATHTLSILSESAGDKTDEILEEEEGGLRFGLVTEETLEKHGVTGRLELRADIDDAALLDGKQVVLERAGKEVGRATFSGGVAIFSDLAAGGYLARPPLRFDYETETEYFTVSQGENFGTLTYRYAPISDYHPTMLKLVGIYKTVGFSIELSDFNRKGTVTLGGANMGNQNNAAWAATPDRVHSSVTIYDTEGEIVLNGESKGDQPFAFPNVTTEVVLDYGYRIRVYTERPDFLSVVSMISGEEITAYRDNGAKERYFLITEDGLVPEWKEGFSVRDELYGAAKETVDFRLRALAEYFGENEDILNSKYLGREKKAEFVEEYEKLRPEDRGEFDELARAVRGGVPHISLRGEQIVERFPSGVDWKKYLSATDDEDGDITLSEHNLRVETDFDGESAGTFTATATVTDSDGNSSSVTFALTVTQRDLAPPVITVKDDVVTVKSPSKVNWTEYVTVTDQEDGDIVLTEENFRVETDFDGKSAGTFTATLIVTDSDGFSSFVNITLVVQGSDPLSAGAIAGIVIGCVVVVAAAVALFVFIYRRER